MKLQDVRKMSEEMLRDAGILNPAEEARLILLGVSGFSLAGYTVRLREEADEGLIKAVLQSVERRSRMEPLQYIMGTAPFYGREFLVGPGVLIPRFDTETLVEAVLPEIGDHMRILDLCTGSGCVILTLMLESGAEGVQGTGSDLSDEALRFALVNEERLGGGARFLKSDLFSCIHEVYDIITANPPYIESDEIGRLEEEVRRFEPHSALDGGQDGLVFYRRIAEEAPEHLSPGGLLALEIGSCQGSSVSGILEKGGFGEIQIFQDTGGRDRVVCARI